MAFATATIAFGFKVLNKFIDEYARDSLGNTIYWVKTLIEERERKGKTCIKKITNNHFRLIFKFPKSQKWNHEIQRILLEKLFDDNMELLDKEELGLLRGNTFIRVFKDSVLFKSYTHQDCTLEFWDYNDLSHKSVSYFSSIF